MMNTRIGFSHMRKLVIIILGVAFFAALMTFSAYLQGVVLSLIEAFRIFAQEAPLLSRLAFIALAAASVLVGPFSSAPIVPLAIAGWGIVETGVFLFLGWMLGDSFAYAIGRYAGVPAVSFVVGKERLEHWISVLKPRMRFSLLLLFRFATPAETGYIFGLLRYDFWKYFLITVLAEIPLVFLVVYAGDAFLVTDWITFGALLVVGVVGIVLTYRLFIKRFRIPDSS